MSKNKDTLPKGGSVTAPPTQPGLAWSEREREIFALELGRATRMYDPAALLRRYQASAHKNGGQQAVVDAFNLLASETQALAAREEQEGESKAEPVALPDRLECNKAAVLLAGVSRDMFLVKSFEEDQENGWTETEQLSALNQYFAYLGAKKKRRKKSPSSSTADGAGQVDGQPTGNSSS